MKHSWAGKKKMKTPLSYGFGVVLFATTGLAQTVSADLKATAPAPVILAKDYAGIRIQANKLSAPELSRLRDEALAGDAHASTVLGMAYQVSCPGASMNAQEALRWYYMAADKGSSIAATQIALSFDPAERFAGTQGQKPEEALKWYRKAAEHGEDAVALYNLAEVLHQQKKDAEAADWYRRALEAGATEAALPLAELYSVGKALPDKGKAENRKEAVEYFQRLATAGNAGAQFVIGKAYQEGLFGLHRDPKEAFTWLLKAAEQGMPDAEIGIVPYYLSGYGDSIPKDTVQGVKWLQRAADHDEAVAQLALAQHYENGDGVAADAAAAYMWYELARENGAPGTKTPTSATGAGSWVKLHHHYTDVEIEEGNKRLHAWLVEHGHVLYRTH